MNSNEEKTRKDLESEGYIVLHTGWPDFLCFKENKGLLTDIRVVEVKTNGDKLSDAQVLVKMIFAQLKVPYEIKRGQFSRISGKMTKENMK